MSLGVVLLVLVRIQHHLALAGYTLRPSHQEQPHLRRIQGGKTMRPIGCGS